MNDGYRSDLAAAQARIAELEAKLSERDAIPELQKLEEEHGRRVRAVPKRWRVWLAAGLAAFVTLITVPFMVLPSSPYAHNPRFELACQLVAVLGMAMSAAFQWMGRYHALQMVALSERLLAAERARLALQASQVRVAERARIAGAEPLESEQEPEIERNRATR